MSLFPTALFSIARMRPSKTKALRKRASPREAGQSGIITRSRRSFYFILEGMGEIELDGERRMELTGSATWPVEPQG